MSSCTKQIASILGNESLTSSLLLALKLMDIKQIYSSKFINYFNQSFISILLNKIQEIWYG